MLIGNGWIESPPISDFRETGVRTLEQLFRKSAHLSLHLLLIYLLPQMDVWRSVCPAVIPALYFENWWLWVFPLARLVCKECVWMCACLQGFETIVVLVAKLCPSFCDPMNYNPQGSSVHGISQARLLEWVAISFSRGSSQTRDRTCISCVGRHILYHWAPGKPKAIALTKCQTNI